MRRGRNVLFFFFVSYSILKSMMRSIMLLRAAVSLGEETSHWTKQTRWRASWGLAKRCPPPRGVSAMGIQPRPWDSLPSAAINVFVTILFFHFYYCFLSFFTIFFHYYSENFSSCYVAGTSMYYYYENSLIKGYCGVYFPLLFTLHFHYPFITVYFTLITVYFTW